MAIVVSLDGRRGQLARLLPYFKTLSARLFAVDLLPQPDTDSSEFVQPTWAGYEPKPLKEWSTVYLAPDRAAETSHPRVVWTRTDDGPPAMIYGYWITDPQGRVLWSERDPRAPVAIDGFGGKYALLPRYDLGKLCILCPILWTGGVSLGGSWLLP